ncbi:MAG: hypothetical protein GY803_25280 [Chloroflexi bacterium]|nr:hypothetical protein [Chloroflexota bacterium]
MNAKSVILFLLVMPLAACNSPAPEPEPLPTAVPVAALPTETATSLPPTLDFVELTGTPPPTPITPTRKPTATATAVTPHIGITSPKADSEMMLGTDVTVRGLLQKQAGQSVWLKLVSWNGRILQDIEAGVDEQSWTASFTVPIYVSGAAYLEAEIRDENGYTAAENRLSVSLVTDTNTEERYLVMSRPVGGEMAVSGFNVFFDGTSYRPIDSVVAISIWVDDCQTRVTRQNFMLGRSTYPIYWQGFTIIPENISGPGCAIAHTGEPGTADWREAVVPIKILPTDDAEAKGIQIGNPPPDSHVIAGRELYLYGSAQNVSEEPVSVSILMENGRIVSQETAPADYWGYWEFRVTIPPDVFGPAQVTVLSGDAGGDNYAEAQILINIDPAPTPES